MSEAELKSFQEAAAKKVAAYVKTHEIVPAAEITRKFPAYRRVIRDVLNDLKDSGKVYWEEWRPRPTMIYAGDRPNTKRRYDWLARQVVNVN